MPPRNVSNTGSVIPDTASLTFSQIVHLCVNHPTLQNRTLLHRRVVHSNVYAYTPNAKDDHGKYHYDPNRQIFYPIHEGTQGLFSLQVFCNIPKEMLLQENSIYAAIKGITALKTAKSLGMGLAIQYGHGRWTFKAHITAQQVNELVDGNSNGL